ncbi:DUF523 domain-containing protein [Clostridium estertheticum]|uniref:DUF523 domain-containing protein n=1 Tax=Clostridium estertheticum TaxID=238834 RepID=UPI001CF1EDD2|nr:DUF523 domain-containing protein [Clostridium estertheticum]MCB2353984.1 DUF523 domain-containing protein [Clostridium estertheticum]WAG43122.1 DUF523 domain-containing protein [Clostridium estertheticum]
MIIVSSCLCGINCRYDGSNNLDTRVLKLLKEGKALPVCPEQLGGLATPREPCEILNGSGIAVIDGKATIIGAKNNDLTSSFLKGAYETLIIAEQIGATTAILKARSPSCGVCKIYDGTFSGTLRPGNGVTAELLLSKGIKVFTEEDLDDIKL